MQETIADGTQARANLIRKRLKDPRAYCGQILNLGAGMIRLLAYTVKMTAIITWASLLFALLVSDLTELPMSVTKALLWYVTLVAVFAAVVVGLLNNRGGFRNTFVDPVDAMLMRMSHMAENHRHQTLIVEQVLLRHGLISDDDITEKPATGQKSAELHAT